MIGIYKITSPSGRVYIGQSIAIDIRMNQYRQGYNCKGQPRLHVSLVKYSFSEHIFEIVEQCSVEELNIRERHWQDFYNVLGEMGLNCKLQNTYGKSGKLSEDTKRRISRTKTGVEHSAESIEKMRGREVSEETRQKQRDAKLGRKLSQEVINKIAEANRGSKRSEESRAKMSEAQKGKKLSGETKRKISESRKKSL
jgi:group I intron endonuclease